MATTSDQQKKQRKKDLSLYSTTNPAVKEMIALGVPPGHFNTQLEEEFPAYDYASGEIVRRGMNNADIVIGRDRPASMASGKGGNGETRCGAIDIVAGRLAGIGSADGSIKTGPNFAADAARVYITQRGNIDEYFALYDRPGGIARPSSKNRSAVAIKADHARIIGRESVKIYVGKGAWEGTGWSGEPLSTGGDMEYEGVIELQASGKPVQPAVRGENLAIVLRHLFDVQRSLVGAVHSHHMLNLKQLGHEVGHVHSVFGVGAAVAAPDPSLLIGSTQGIIKNVCGHVDAIMKQMNNYLTEFNALGLGPESAKIPGFQSILSTNVYLS